MKKIQVFQLSLHNLDISPQTPIIAHPQWNHLLRNREMSQLCLFQLTLSSPIVLGVCV